MKALVRLGSRHNRSHVQDGIVLLVQGVRDHDRAVAALETLQAAMKSEVRWTVSDFVLRSMHPSFGTA